MELKVEKKKQISLLIDSEKPNILVRRRLTKRIIGETIKIDRKMPRKIRRRIINSF